MPLPSESSVVEEFEEFRRSLGFIDVPLSLWVPDEGAVAYAWLGWIQRVFFRRTSRRLRHGLLPARFHGHWVRGPAACRRQARVWVRELPVIGPARLLQTIRDGLDDAPLAARTQFRQTGWFDLVFAVGKAGSDDAVALAERHFSLSQGTVEHSWMQVAKTAQNQGLAARVIGALLPLYEELRIYQIRITAALSAGGAVWAKFGFVPDADEWARIRRIIEANIGAVMLQRGVPQAAREACETAAWLVKTPDPKNLWLISDVAGIQTVDGVRLGTLLLRNVRWRGSLSFADGEAVNRLRDRLALSRVGLTALDSLAAAASRKSL